MKRRSAQIMLASLVSGAIAPLAIGEALATNLNLSSELLLNQDTSTGQAQPGLAPSFPSWGGSVQFGSFLPWYSSGNFLIDGVTSEQEFKIGDTFDDSNPWSADLRIEMFHESGWGFFFNSQYLDHRASNVDLFIGATKLAAKADTTFKHAILDAGVAYRMLDSPANSDGVGRAALDLFGGIRYQYTDNDIYVDSATHIHASEGWWEPMFGVRANFGIAPGVAINFRGDFSGFSQGEASDFTWLIEGGVDWWITNNFAIQTNYRVLDIDWTHGDGFNHSVNLTLNGPYVGGVLHF